jgi:hypothetical protein
MTISKKVTAKITNSGKNDKKVQVTAIADTALPIDHTNPIKILSKICPDNILANNRTDKLTTLAKYDTNSIKNKTGTINNGTPSGKKSLNHFSFW